MRLCYYTRKNAWVPGLPRLFLTGHPEEVAARLDEMAEDILRFWDCMICRDLEPFAPYDQEELLNDLEQIQVLAVMVTRRFLSEPNRARDLEIPYALERGILILPIAQEEGLGAAFNAVFQDQGVMQLLKKSDFDYREKLKKFFESRVKEDQDHAYVCEAFRTKIFLSYRKADRMEAQELMRQICKVPCCWDAAVWYDEFLLPGENFNEDIAAQINGCSLFVLTVTPWMLEADSYARTMEYPQAQAAGKTVIPVEVSPTDRAALARAFPGLPPCVRPEDLPAVLEKAIADLDLPESGLPEEDRLFRIALACQRGIQTMVDRSRALELLVRAAEAENPDAAERLANMYWYGINTRQDCEISMAWQQKLVNIWRGKCQDESHFYTEPAKEWVQAMITWVSRQKELGHYEGLEEMCLAAQDVSKMLADAGAGDLLLEAQVQKELGDIYQDMGRLEASWNSWQACLNASLKRYQETQELTARKLAYDTSVYMADLCTKAGNMAMAWQCIQQAETLLEPVIAWEDGQETRTADSWQEYSFLKSMMGSLCYMEADLKKALPFFQDALRGSEMLYRQIKAEPIKRLLAMNCFNIGLCILEQKAPERCQEGRRHMLRSIELFQELYKDIPIEKERQREELRKRLKDAYQILRENSGRASKE